MLLYNVVYSVRNIYWWTFFRKLFYYYSQQVLHANESLIPYNLIKREAETMFKRWPVNQCIKSFNKFI